MSQELHIENLNTLIAHLEAQPPERINMGYGVVDDHPCGTCGCILGHAQIAFPMLFHFAPTATVLGLHLGISYEEALALTHPHGWLGEQSGVVRYPAHRVISTLKRLRDHYLATGEIVVDWGPEPGSEPAQSWSAPQAVEMTTPELPEELTRLLAPKSDTVEAVR